MAVLSDVHGNLPALEAVLADATRRGARSVVNLGDLVGYSTFALEVIHRLREMEIPSVRGNHDMMAAGDLEPDRCGPNARKAIEWTRAILTAEDREYLRKLPQLMMLEPDSILVHSMLTDPVAYLRRAPQFVEERRKILAAHPGVKVCFTGHTHKGAVVEIDDRGAVHESTPVKTRLDEGAFCFVNPGSVGHPRGEDYRASYVLFRWEERSVEFRKVRYPVRTVRTANRRHGIVTDLGPSMVAFRLRVLRNRLHLSGGRRFRETSGR